MFEKAKKRCDRKEQKERDETESYYYFFGGPFDVVIIESTMLDIF